MNEKMSFGRIITLMVGAVVALFLVFAAIDDIGKFGAMEELIGFLKTNLFGVILACISLGMIGLLIAIIHVLIKAEKKSKEDALKFLKYLHDTIVEAVREGLLAAGFKPPKKAAEKPPAPVEPAPAADKPAVAPVPPAPPAPVAPPAPAPAAKKHDWLKTALIMALLVLLAMCCCQRCKNGKLREANATQAKSLTALTSILEAWQLPVPPQDEINSFDINKYWQNVFCPWHKDKLPELEKRQVVNELQNSNLEQCIPFKEISGNTAGQNPAQPAEPGKKAAQTTGTECGNGNCEDGESTESCPLDCPSSKPAAAPPEKKSENTEGEKPEDDSSGSLGVKPGCEDGYSAQP